MSRPDPPKVSPPESDRPSRAFDPDDLDTLVTQVATVGSDEHPPLAGVGPIPVHRMVLLHPAKRPRTAERLRGVLRPIGVETELTPVPEEVMPTLRAVQGAVEEAHGAGHEVLVNVGSGPRPMVLGAVLAAYIAGAKAFDVRDGRLQLLPVLRLEATEIVSETKMDLLRALDRMDGRVESLDELGEAAEKDKSTVSYHIRGPGDAPGLEDIGLVEVERGRHGRLGIRLSDRGELLLLLDGEG